MVEYLGCGRFDPPETDAKTYLLDFLTQNGPLARDVMMRQTGIPRSTLYDILVTLILEEKVSSFRVKRSVRGRPLRIFEVNGKPQAEFKKFCINCHTKVNIERLWGCPQCGRQLYDVV